MWPFGRDRVWSQHRSRKLNRTWPEATWEDTKPITLHASSRGGRSRQRSTTPEKLVVKPIGGAGNRFSGTPEIRHERKDRQSPDDIVDEETPSRKRRIVKRLPSQSGFHRRGTSRARLQFAQLQGASLDLGAAAGRVARRGAAAGRVARRGAAAGRVARPGAAAGRVAHGGAEGAQARRGTDEARWL